MIVSFSFSNFRSVAGEQTLSFVASKKFQDGHNNHSMNVPGSDEKVLRVGVLYGANGAGKSNVFKALTYVEAMATETRNKNGGTAREPFRFSKENQDLPSSFDLQFIVADKLYRFGFAVDDERILEEWLVRVEGGREIVLYERVVSAEGKSVIKAPVARKAGKSLAALATIGGPQNQTFLATINATLEEENFGDEIRAILTWFEVGLDLVSPTTSYPMLNERLAQDEDFLKFAGEFMRGASTGVYNLVVNQREVTESEIRAMMPEAIATQMLETTKPGETTVVQMPLGGDVLLERSAQDHFYFRTIQAVHEDSNGKVMPLNLDEESDGTQRLLDLLPALYELHTTDAVYFIDEIDRSMHPLLVWKFLEFFLNGCGQGRSQIIVTTHESNLLDLDLLRRDEIWFAEKDPAGATRLYSLADFKIRKDLEIRKHYLQGRFGAIPFLGNLDQLLTQQEAQC